MHIYLVSAAVIYFINIMCWSGEIPLSFDYCHKLWWTRVNHNCGLRKEFNAPPYVMWDFSIGPQVSLQSENRSLGVLYIISLSHIRMRWATKGGHITTCVQPLALKDYDAHEDSNALLYASDYQYWTPGITPHKQELGGSLHHIQ